MDRFRTFPDGISSMNKINRGSKNFYLLISMAMVIWGGAWVSGKLVAVMMPAQVLAFYRFIVTFIACGLILIIIREKPLPGKKPLLLILFATFFYVIYAQLFFQGLKNGLAGVGGVLVTTLNPVFTFFILSMINKKGMSLREASGLILGICGGAVILKVWDLSPEKILLSGNLFFVAAAFMWASVTVSSQNAQKNMSIWTYTFYLNGFAALAQLPFAVPLGIMDVFSLGFHFWSQMFYLAVVSTTLATTMYFYASGKIGPNRASSFTFLVPTSAILSSWIILGENPDITTIGGGVVAVIAVYIINKQARKRGLEPIIVQD